MRKDIKIGFCIEKVSKIDLVEYLEEEVKPKTLGLKEDYLPEKQWLVNILYTENSDHKVFKYIKD